MFRLDGPLYMVIRCEKVRQSPWDRCSTAFAKSCKLENCVPIAGGTLYAQLSLNQSTGQFRAANSGRVDNIELFPVATNHLGAFYLGLEGIDELCLAPLS